MTRSEISSSLVIVAAFVASFVAACTIPNYAFDAAIRSDATCITCGTACVDLMNDPDHCGACATVCPGGSNAVRACTAGHCIQACMNGFGNCDRDDMNGCETVLAESAANCGACGTACSAPANADGTCRMSQCSIQCRTGFANCDGDLANGCETDTVSALVNCGMCGNVCPADRHATPGCTSGRCTQSCETGYQDCESAVAGCETNVMSSGLHCGRCNSACPAGQVCAAGTCGSTCPMGQTVCTSSCVDTSNDPDNCGACRTQCPSGPNGTPTCTAGTCRLDCRAGFADCNGVPADGCEVVLASAVANCGTCGNACPARTGATAICGSGTCGFACSAGRGDCNMSASDGCEADVTRDTANCGVCGRACSSGAFSTAICTMGLCGLTCTAGYADCDRAASTGCEVNTNTSSTHCGMCGRACPAGQFCNAGSCVLSCAPRTLCGTSCVDVQTDEANCGACSTACPGVVNASAVCTAGRCGFMCSAGWGDCTTSSGCETNTNTSTSHCGMCGAACPARANAASSCVSGVCGFACMAGYANCDANATNGCEVNTNTTIANCGVCGRVCAGAAGATPTCVAGVCGISCSAGNGDCDSNPTNGCESNLNTNTLHCGACPTACPARANASLTCAAGVCGFTCSAGFGNCDANATNGCEANLNTTPTRCGSCTNSCPVPANGTATCTAGACGVACNAGYVVSGSTCVSIPAPRHIGPPSTAIVTTNRPLLRWVNAAPSDGAIVEICSDRACTTIERTETVTGTTVTVGVALTRGPHFWRLRGRAGATPGTVNSAATWQLTVFATTAPGVNTYYMGEPDTNGDGWNDALVGLYNRSSMRLYYGASAGLPASAAGSATITVAGGSAGYTSSIANAGDTNGDGFGDVVVGSCMPNAVNGTYDATTCANRAYVYRGQAATGLGAATTLAMPSGASAFGYDVSSAGDVNRDGYSDVVVGAYTSQTVYVFHGSSSGIATTPNTTLSGGTAGSLWGLSVASGDFNADGYSDLVVGGGTSNYINVYFGSTSGITTTGSQQLTYGTVGFNFGLSVDCAGDTDQDGYPDLVVGGNASLGVVEIHRGGTGSLATAAYSRTGTAASRFGLSVSTAGDTNGDGYADIIVGETGTTPPRAHVLRGSTSSVQNAGEIVISGTAGTLYGRFVEGLGDVDRDGYFDVMVGDCALTIDSTCNETVRVYDGSPSGTQTSGGRVYSGVAGDGFGHGFAWLRPDSAPRTRLAWVPMAGGALLVGSSNWAAAPPWLRGTQGSRRVGVSGITEALACPL